jgi:hypothetical protein
MSENAGGFALRGSYEWGVRRSHGDRGDGIDGLPGVSVANTNR